MTLPSWLRDRTPASTPTLKKSRRSRSKRPPATRRLLLESLEDRFCLSSYGIVDIGTLGGASSFASAVNASGQVVGGSDTAAGAGYSHAFLWQNGIRTDLGTLGGPRSGATDINDAGQIVGGSSPAGSTTNHAFLWQNGIMSDLGTLGGDASGAGAINNHSQIVGYSKTAGGGFGSFVWENGVMYNLDALLPVNSGWVTQALNGIDVNDKHQIAGTGLFNGVQRAFLITDSDGVFANGGLTITNLGSLVGGGSSTGAGINNLGQVVGSSSSQAGLSHAFRYSGGVMTDLKTIGGSPTQSPYSSANAINDAGQIVGASGAAGTGASTLFLWQNGKMTDLNKELPRGSAWVLTSTSDINGTGQIVGQGSIGGQRHAFLLVSGGSVLQSPAVHTASAETVTTLSAAANITPTNSTSKKTAAVQIQSPAVASSPSPTPAVVDLVLNAAPLDRTVPALNASQATVNDDLFADYFALDSIADFIPTSK